VSCRLACGVLIFSGVVMVVAGYVEVAAVVGVVMVVVDVADETV
jgi:hypothetical protein